MNTIYTIKIMICGALWLGMAFGTAQADQWGGKQNTKGTIWRSGKVVVGSKPEQGSATLEVYRPMTGSDDLLFSVNAPFRGMANNRFEVDEKHAYAGGAKSKRSVLPGDYDFAVHRGAAIGVLNIDERIPNGYHLVVGGKILAEEVRIKVIEKWSDDVFDDDYDLQSLTQVEAFIQANHHLPDVPDAEEVATNGIGLGHMQSTLLRKIEELTLHLIDQHKTIELLKQKLDLLEQQAN